MIGTTATPGKCFAASAFAGPRTFGSSGGEGLRADLNRLLDQLAPPVGSVATAFVQRELGVDQVALVGGELLRAMERTVGLLAAGQGDLDRAFRLVARLLEALSPLPSRETYKEGETATKTRYAAPMKTGEVSMGWTEKPLSHHFGMELTGQRLSIDLPQSERDAVYAAVIREGVVVVRDQGLSDEELEAFAATLGTVLSYPGLGMNLGNVLPLTNIGPDGKLLPEDADSLRASVANMLWHIDSTYTRPRATVSMLYGRVVPPVGANTEFCDLRHAWDRLSADEQARLATMTASHSIIHSRELTGYADWSEKSRAGLPAIDRPLVRDHEETSRTALLIASHIEKLTGLTKEESVALVADLTARATTPDNVYSHVWRQGDLLLWDNRCVMHRGTPFEMSKYPRDMRTTRLVDVADMEPA